MGSTLAAPVSADRDVLDHSDFSEKILPLPELGAECEHLRQQGHKIAHCHGIFDLLHIGHLRHLEMARRLGDRLVVTITCDEFVNKGPDRPAFTEALRAEMLAALAIVDFVAIVYEPSAVSAINHVKPDIYAKGREYGDASADITGKIVHEQETVESHGGEIVFTHGITFSSSNLLNKYLPATNEDARRYLNEVRESGLAERLEQLFDLISQMRVLIVGETIIDRYVYVEALGKAAKETIIATQLSGEETFAGGVIAAANNLSALCPNVDLLTVIGSSRFCDNHEGFIRSSLSESITPHFIEKPEAPTIQKSRFVEPTHIRKLFEVYEMDDRPLPGGELDQFHALLHERAADVDAVIVCDFGHGLFQPPTIRLLMDQAKFLAVNAQSNAGNLGYNIVSKYPRADFVCVDTLEARLAVQQKHADPAAIADGGLQSIIDTPNIIITNGKHGCYASDGISVTHVPAFVSNVVDTVGAGDTFYVAATAVMAAGGDCADAGFVGNVAGALKTAIVGHRRSLTQIEIKRFISTLLK